MAMARKAAVYARYSSDNQRDESIDAQIRAIEDHASRNDLEIVKVYVDKAKSATTDKRPEFQQMIKDSSLGIFEVLIVHKLDRFSRNKYDSALYKRTLRMNGIDLISVTENLDGSPESVILESMLEGMAQYYSANLAREVMKGLTETAHQCKHTGGCPPIGYDLNADKTYKVNEKEAEAVKLIYNMYDGGHSYSDIIRVLKKHGYKTKSNKGFAKNSLSSILRNEKYSGVYVFNRAASKDAAGKRNNHKPKPEEEIIRIEGGMPQIISKELFERVQKKIVKRNLAPGANKANELYLLSGLIQCGECGHSMVGNCRKEGSKPKFVSYRCGCRKSKLECSNKEIRKEAVEEFVLTELERQILNKNAIPVIAKKMNDYIKERTASECKNIDFLRGELKQVEDQIEKAIALLFDGLVLESIKAKLNELQNRKNDIEIAIAKYEAERQDNVVVTEDLIRTMFSNFKQYVLTRNIPECKAFIHNFVKKVLVFQDHIEVIFNVVFSFLGTDSTYEKKVQISRRGIFKDYTRIA